MALDISGISSTAKNRLEALDYEKYRSFNSLLTILKKTQKIPDRQPGGYLPLNKDEYKGTTAFEKKIHYHIELNKLIGANKEIGLFSHDTYSDPEFISSYFIIKNFAYLHKFIVLYRQNTNQLSINFTKFIEDSNTNNLVFAAPGLFHDDERTISYPYTNWFVQGQVYVGGNKIFNTIRGSYSPGMIQFNPNISYPGSPKRRFEVRTGEPDAGDGFTTLIPIITDSVINRNVGAYTGTNTVGKTFLFYNRPEDMLIYFIQPHGGQTNIQTVLDMIQILDFTDGVILDGSDSTFLYEYAGKGKGRFINSYIKKTFTKNNSMTGLKVACGFK